MGLALAASGGLVTWLALAVFRRLCPGRGAALEPYRLPDDAPPWVRAVEHVARGTHPAMARRGRAHRFHYVRTKLLADPVARLVADIEGEAPGVLGEVVDLGAGRGQLSILLVELGRARRAHGVDWDGSKVTAGNGPPGGHCRGVELAKPTPVLWRRTVADTVLLIDLIHYFTLAEQDALLDRAAAWCGEGGRIRGARGRYGAGLAERRDLLEEGVFTAAAVQPRGAVKLRPVREIVAGWEAGLGCEVGRRGARRRFRMC